MEGLSVWYALVAKGTPSTLVDTTADTARASVRVGVCVEESMCVCVCEEVAIIGNMLYI